MDDVVPGVAQGNRAAEAREELNEEEGGRGAERWGGYRCQWLRQGMGRAQARRAKEHC